MGRERSLTLAGALLAMALLNGALNAQEAPVTLAPGVGVQTVESRCTVCHPPTMITAQRRSARQWAGVVDQMIGKGAQVSDAEYDVIVAYLARTYGTETAGATQPPN